VLFVADGGWSGDELLSLTVLLGYRSFGPLGALLALAGHHCAEPRAPSSWGVIDFLRQRKPQHAWGARWRGLSIGAGRRC